MEKIVLPLLLCPVLSFLGYRCMKVARYWAHGLSLKFIEWDELNIFTYKPGDFHKRNKKIKKKTFEDLINRYSRGEDLTKYPFGKIICEFANDNSKGVKNLNARVDHCMDWLLRLYVGQQQEPPEDYDETAAKLPRGLRMVFTVDTLEREVNNGGFSQYFENTRGVVAKICLEDLAKLGAKHSYQLLKTAIERVESSKPSRRPSRETHEKGEVFADGDMYEGLDDLSKAFWKNPDLIDDLFLKYVKEHPEDFKT
jgi:hypothetical protein